MVAPYIFVPLAVFGLWLCVGWALVSKKARDQLHDSGATGKFLVTLVECPTCFGWWEGLVFGAGVALYTHVSWDMLTIYALAFAFAFAASNTILAALCHSHLVESEDDEDGVAPDNETEE